jgi:hypothetical protein
MGSADMRLERIEYRDHYSDEEWHDIEEMQRTDNIEDLISVSVGWVAAESDDCVRLIQNLDGLEGKAEKCFGTFVIYKSCIVKRQLLA